MNEKSEPREGTVESKVAGQLKGELDQDEVNRVVKRYTLQELCDFVFMKANERGERIKITIRPPLPLTKKGKKNEGKGKKKP
jgi:hypothetical protein